MSTFLEICQDVARESGTISGNGLPTTVASQTGRLLKVVEYTKQAWVDIQNMQDTWRWMRSTFSGDTTAGAACYTANSFNITRFGRWVTDRDDYLPISLYLKATGVTDEGPIEEITYEQWRHRYGRGSHDNNRPTVYAISPANEICLGATPDDTYTINGEYIKSAQVLSADSDEPELPSRFHDIIKWRALDMLNRHDEAPRQVQYAGDLFSSVYYDLARDQLPGTRISGGPLA